jgi:hypothetical protein
MTERERIARIISGAPFPSKRSYDKADQIRAGQPDIGKVVEVLRPFANYAADNTAADPASPGFGVWDGNGCERERIVDWFGPTDFHRASALLSELTSGTGEQPSTATEGETR